MISVIIPTLNAGASLAATLTALVPAVVEGIVREVIIADGGSRDRTLDIADNAGVVVVKSAPGRGVQLRAGADAARFPWLLFLHADTVLEPGWEREAAIFCERVTSDEAGRRAAVFRFALDDPRIAARAVETGVAFRTNSLSLPYGDQGLLISRSLYDAIGGYPASPIMEDVAIIRRLGRARLHVLRSKAITSATRYRERGYLRRVLRNQACLALYFAGAPLPAIERIYAHRPRHQAPHDDVVRSKT
jgi:rSAM/selenodomain-associated transferase 2